MPFLSVRVALYNYEANTEQELSIKKNDILYILENDDPHWWKAKLKTADPNHLHVGLVPSNYVDPPPPIGIVLGLYSYEAATEEELTFEQGDTLTLYEQDDPDWFLVGNGFQVGFVPRSYVEEINKSEKKKKKKGRLAVSNMSIFFGSEEDKSPVRQWLIKDVIHVRHEKSHVYLDLGGAPPSSLDFKAASKREAVAIFYKIQKFRITHHVTPPASTSLVYHSMSVPTHQTAQGPPNTSAPRTSQHESRSDVPAGPSPISSPALTHAHLATQRVRVVNRATSSSGLQSLSTMSSIGGPTIDPNQTIYLRNLNEKIKKDGKDYLPAAAEAAAKLKRSLYCLFSAYGKVISIIATKTRGGRGQAFVAFSDIVSATTALRGLQGFTIYGKSMEIQYAKNKSHAIAKLDGSYRAPPLRKPGTDLFDQPVSTSAVKREREADSDSDSDSAMSE
ncbi:cytoskeletal protein binding protein [Mortierella sp. NVP85]|nr:cytoskeletal protein binding protein [Mortierella sp. NVP85]